MCGSHKAEDSHAEMTATGERSEGLATARGVSLARRTEFFVVSVAFLFDGGHLLCQPFYRLLFSSVLSVGLDGFPQDLERHHHTALSWMHRL